MSLQWHRTDVVAEPHISTQGRCGNWTFLNLIYDDKFTGDLLYREMGRKNRVYYHFYSKAVFQNA